MGAKLELNICTWLNFRRDTTSDSTVQPFCGVPPKPVRLVGAYAVDSHRKIWGNTYTISKGQLFRFPPFTYSSYEKYCKWKDFLKKKDKEKDDNFISQNFKLCSKHFEQHYITNKKRLTRHAVPTLLCGITHLQEELLCKYIDENPDVIEGYSLSSQMSNEVESKWKTITPKLNARGPDKTVDAWPAYLFEIISDLKKKEIKWESFVSEDKPPVKNSDDFTKVELKILQLWHKEKIEQEQQDHFEPVFEEENDIMNYEIEEADSDDNRDSETSEVSGPSGDNEIVTYTLNLASGGQKPLLQAADISPYHTYSSSKNIASKEGAYYDNSNVECVCNSNREPRDEFDDYGREIAQKLRNMPLQTALQTRKQLMAVLRSKQSKLLNNSFLEN